MLENWLSEYRLRRWRKLKINVALLGKMLDKHAVDTTYSTTAEHIEVMESLIRLRNRYQRKIDKLERKERQRVSA